MAPPAEAHRDGVPARNEDDPSGSQDRPGLSADFAELRGFLTGTAEITVHPQPAGAVPLHVLATRRGLQAAAELGLPVIVGARCWGWPAIRTTRPPWPAPTRRW
jgi:hypothetical protein